MKIEFCKMSGAGNDFIMVNNMDSSLDHVLSNDFIRNLCQRGLSVGADGLIEMRSDPEYPFRMKYYNSDGYSAGMCGNGGRCIVVYAVLQDVAPSTGAFSFRSDAGIHKAEITSSNTARIWMTDPIIHFLNKPLDLPSKNNLVSFLDTGVPHAVLFIDNDDFDTFKAHASTLRSNEIFGAAGANVNYVSIPYDSGIKIRTWERGVEGETLACGTGAVASAICANLLYDQKIPIRIQVKSGQSLSVGKNGDGWWLEGEARPVYSAVLLNL
ncbi:MAG: diaminopimelate epimerase [Candidatus Fermentibacteraceae bacterium]|nr:diaminopimelate epimerase [Candidatus Fermentibacteraceae bacterium]